MNKILPPHLAQKLAQFEKLRALVLDSLKEAGGALAPLFLKAEIKGEVLTIFFSHKVGVSEFKYKEGAVLEAMRELYKERGLRNELFFRSVRAEWFLVSLKEREAAKKREMRERECAWEDYHYKEQSDGEFEISEDCSSELRERFLKIQEAIRQNRLKEPREA